ncbi:LEA type 2 family protein [Halococcus hamelinensis]|uniref:Water stress and hypersensitive response domain-containing protein n=1 Tax=Halococcus hamelinensis 100A6 TaxID=1132509 RepID=M0LW05_9EURY|nr:LEA type 2 family protein [Halococcus hamelinensis]EMA36285.1 hypothetical protein C447_15971 [Halococcus hamelinensis 100A6]
MGRLTRLLVGLLVLAALLAVALGVVAVGFDRPSIVESESRIVGVNATTTVVETDLTVSNPNPVAVRLGDATVATNVSMNGIEVGAGTKRGIRLGRGATDVSLTTVIDNREIPDWWVSHVRNGERTRVTTTANVTLPVLGRTATLTDTTTTRTSITDRLNSSAPRPINASLPLVSDPILVVERTRASWGDVTTETTPLEIRTRLANPTSIPLSITRLDYTVTMNGITVGNGTTGEATTVPAGGQESLRAETDIRNERLDDWWVTHVQRGQRTDLRVSFTAVLSLPGGETARVPLDGLDYATTIDTDVLANDSTAQARLGGLPTNHEDKHASATGTNPGR